ncbi:hypothetical protein Hypma_016027 [Hypsizygus marmoreus]|uniref:Uncharacterized protein n=1 Tax=Hypsizygus marmoreus TaxID=39966 RepID=A0A369K6N4_HYPMA|nr:hypothetical protein Hypma_016027 [Hypsizygus marmoreus]
MTRLRLLPTSNVPYPYTQGPYAPLRDHRTRIFRIPISVNVYRVSGSPSPLCPPSLPALVRDLSKLLSPSMHRRQD